MYFHIIVPISDMMIEELPGEVSRLFTTPSPNRKHGGKFFPHFLSLLLLENSSS
jgi:hypothetical protein